MGATPQPLGPPVTLFSHVADGWSAAINSTTLYRCDRCGACIVERSGDGQSRQLHSEWHAR